VLPVSRAAAGKSSASRREEFVVLVEIVEDFRRDAESLGENVVAHSVQTHGNSNVCGHAAIECEQQSQITGAHALDGVKPSLRDKDELARLQINHLFHRVSRVVRPCDPEPGLTLKAIVQLPGIGMPVWNPQRARLQNRSQAGSTRC